MQEEIGNLFVAHEQISQIEGDIPEDVTEMFTTAKDCCRDRGH